ncbi:MAG: hypothetical protein IKE29_21145 [Paenibacillus sp.]|uniref:hypothetical protein n=1 Tax=Paenibacillus sp. TaxID=58172 RepID=UPI0025F7C1D4|nr:hypothetical protein [Paenibacillus sp.]MBR2567096.1 hypothetical protein [Paenibacillus sp.]
MNKTLNEYEVAFLQQFSHSDWVATRSLPNPNHSLYDETIAVKPKNGEHYGVVFKIVYLTSTFDFLMESERVLEIKYELIGSANIKSEIANAIAQTVKKVALQNSISVIHIRYSNTIFDQSGFDYKERSFYWIGDQKNISNELLRQSIQEDGRIDSETATQQTFVDYFSRIVKQYMTITDTKVIGRTTLRFIGQHDEYFNMELRFVPISPRDRGTYLDFHYKQVDGESMMKHILKELVPFAKMKGYNHYKHELFGYTKDSTIKLNEIEQAMLRVYRSLGFNVKPIHEHRYGDDDRSWYSVSKQLY